MNFRVIRTPQAVLQLNRIWPAATDHSPITAAALAISHALGGDPHAVGQHLFDTLYQYDRPPLAVEFEVIDADQQVLVLTCWSTETGRPPVTGN